MAAAAEVGRQAVPGGQSRDERELLRPPRRKRDVDLWLWGAMCSGDERAMQERKPLVEEGQLERR